MGNDYDAGESVSPLEPDAQNLSYNGAGRRRHPAIWRFLISSIHSVPWTDLYTEKNYEGLIKLLIKLNVNTLCARPYHY